MPHIDVSTIEGYEGMTPEQKVEALLKVEVPEKVDLSGYVSKKVFDDKASEAADLSKRLKEKMTDEEKAKAAQDEAAKEQAKKFADLEAKYAELEKQTVISANKAKFLGMGWSETLAEETAKAMADGDTEKVFANQKKFQEEYEKKLKADLLKETPNPEGGSGGEGDKGLTLAQKIGKAKAAANAATADVLKNYIK